MNLLKLEHYVNDVSKVLSESVLHETNERLKNHDTQTTVQSVVYLFPHRQGRELLDIGLEIFNENGIEVVVGVTGSSEDVTKGFLSGEIKSTGSICKDHAHQGEGFGSGDCDEH